ncbi:hypothetical protein ACFFX1_54890 [Dactylosporangium sucinum]|uniref:DUF7352 domain-containing protein n=1 Tax=Dactylosporangium sucinum TaxID=1424081 RepID=A0A917X1M8_9ACTN|nr:hypothetical protein [Dactylosporangium sucinum]GGM53456.1 hypothetical protein GCM10007977_063810 [Dactylosporangium sucinum]
MTIASRVLRHTIPVDDAWHDMQLPGPIVHVATRHPYAVEVWTLHADTQPDTAETRMLRVYGTGQPITEPVRHIGTAIMPGGAFVWHLMERTS